MTAENCGWCDVRPPDKYYRLWYEDAHEDCECPRCSAPACAVCYAEACPDEEVHVLWDAKWNLYDALRRYAATPGLGEWAG